MMAAAGASGGAGDSGLRLAGNASGPPSMVAWSQGPSAAWDQADQTPKPTVWPESPTISLAKSNATESPIHKAPSQHASAESNGAGGDVEVGNSGEIRPIRKGCCARRAPRSARPLTGLQEYAASLRSHHAQESTSSPLYPMYALPMQRFLEMKSMVPHQDLKQEGNLVSHEDSAGPTIFLSHQWCADSHPDPDFKQFSILQEAFRNLRDGRARVQIDLLNQTAFNVSGELSAAEREEILTADIWCDYFSVPQRDASVEANAAQLEGAALSIPVYAQMADYFLILAPPVDSAFHKSRLSYESWRRRGWCRLERAAWALAAGGTRMLLVSSVDQISVLGVQDVLFAPPGCGDFTVAADRQRIAPIMESLVEHRLDQYLRDGQLDDYRMLLSLRSSMMSGFSSCSRDVGVRRFRSFMDSQGKLKTEDRAVQFLLDYGFDSVAELDGFGRTALHFAAVAGDCMVIRRLLILKGDLHCRTKKADSTYFLRPGSTPLHLAALLNRQWQVAKLLLDQDASVDDKRSFDNGSFEGTALYQSCVSENLPIAGMLLERRINLECRDREGNTPLLLSALFGNVELTRALLASRADATAVDDQGKNALHMLAIFSCCRELVRDIVQARCPIDGRHHNISSRFALGSSKVANRLGSQNPLVKMMHQLPGMTPLMCAAFLGNRDVALELLRCKADLEACNDQQLAAAELAQLARMPGYFVVELMPDGEARDQRNKAYLQEVDSVRRSRAATPLQAKPRSRHKRKSRKHQVAFRPSVPAHLADLMAAEAAAEAARKAEALAAAHEAARARGEMMEVVWAAFDGSKHGEDYLILEKGLSVRYLNREEEGWLWGELVDPMNPEVPLGAPGWYPPNHTVSAEVFRQKVSQDAAPPGLAAPPGHIAES